MPLSDEQKDFLKQYHSDLVKDLHESQRNFIQLVIPIVSAMAVYGYGLDKILPDSPSAASEKKFDYIYSYIFCVNCTISNCIFWSKHPCISTQGFANGDDRN
ncbi:hypothetical protein [Thermodesulfovibrio hydrogeniphilus]